MPTEWKTKNLTVKELLKVDGNLSVGGTTYQNSTATVYLGGKLNVAQETTMQGKTEILNELSISGKTEIQDNLSVSGTTVVIGDLSVGGTTYLGLTTQQTIIKEDLVIQDQLDVQGPAILSSSATIYGDTNISGHVTLKNDLSVGGILKASQFSLLENNNNPTNELFLKAGSDLSENRTLTLTTGDSDRNVTFNGDIYFNGNGRIDFLASDKKLYIENDTYLNQDLTTDSSPTFSSLTISNDIVLNGKITTGTWEGNVISSQYINDVPITKIDIHNSSEITDPLDDNEIMIFTGTSTTIPSNNRKVKLRNLVKNYISSELSIGENIQVVGTLTQGIWNATAIENAYIGSGISGVKIDILNTTPVTSLLQTDKFLLYQTSTTNKSISFSDFEDSIFDNVSGDATISAGGNLIFSESNSNLKSLPALETTGTITTGVWNGSQIQNLYLAPGIHIEKISINGGESLGSSGLTEGDKFLFYDASSFSNKTITYSNLFGKISTDLQNISLSQLAITNTLTMENGSNLLFHEGAQITQPTSTILRLQEDVIEIIGAETISSTLSVGSNSFINGTLSVSNSINIEENLSIAGNLVINSDTANITHTGIGNLTVYSSLGSVEIEEVVINGKDLSNVGTISAQNLNLDNTFTINDLLATTVKSTSTLSVGGTTTLNSTVNINGTTNIDGALSMGSVLYFSNGSDITNSDLGVLNINELLTTFSGDIKINGNDITFGFGATITNNDLDTLTITESDLVVDGNLSANNVTVSNNIIIGNAIIDETDLEKIDDITNGTAAANKALVLDGSKNIVSINKLGASQVDSQLISSDTGIDMQSTNNLTLDSSDGDISIGADDNTGSINIGTSATARVLAIGSNTTTSLSSKAININVDSVNSTNITTGTTFDVQSTGNLTLDSSNGDINIGSDTNSGTINLGNSASARTINIGNDSSTKIDLNALTVELDSGGNIILSSETSTDMSSGSTFNIGSVGNLSLNSSNGSINLGDDNDTGDINIGTSASARAITIGNTSSNSLTLNALSFSVNAYGTTDIQSSSHLSIDSSNGDISIGSDVNTGTINIGTSTSSRTINIGNDASAKIDLNATEIEIDSGGELKLDSVGAASLISSNTIDLQSFGNVSIDSSNGNINIGTDNNSGAINIGTNASARIITFGSTSASLINNANSFNLNTTTTTLSSTSATNISSSSIIDLQSTDNLTIDSSSGSINIGVDNAIGSINIGTSASARTISIGNDSSTKIDLNANVIELDSEGTIVITSDSSTSITSSTFDLESVGSLTLDSSNGSIGIGTENFNGAINIGTSSTGRNITIGNSASNTTRLDGITVDLNAQTGGISLDSVGDSNFTSSAGVITIDGNDGINLVGRDAGITLDTLVGGSVEINASGKILLGNNNATSNNINYDIEIGNSTTSRRIQLGYNTSLTYTSEVELNAQLIDINAGTSGITINSDSDVNLNTSNGNINLDGKSGISLKIDGSNALTIDNNKSVTVLNDLNVEGGITVTGSASIINSTSLSIDDKMIIVGTGNVDSVYDLGIIFTRGDGSNTNIHNRAIIWDESEDLFAFVNVNTLDGSTDQQIDYSTSGRSSVAMHNINSTGNITLSSDNSSIIHSGSTKLSISSTSGSVDIENVNFDGQNISNISNLTASTLTGSISTSSQPNITTIGTLTSLTVDNISFDGNLISSSSGDLNITPNTGSAIVLDDTINIDGGVITGATSITSTDFSGSLTGDFTGNVNIGSSNTLKIDNTTVTSSASEINKLTGLTATTD